MVSDGVEINKPVSLVPVAEQVALIVVALSRRISYRYVVLSSVMDSGNIQ